MSFVVFISKNVYMIFWWDNVWVQIWDFSFVFIGQDFDQLQVKFSDKFQGTDNLYRFGCILIDKHNK